MLDSITHTSFRRTTPREATSAVALLLCVTAGVAVTMPASARASAPPVTRSLATTTVTIKAQGLDLSGTVSSTRQGCVTDRKVVVFKQIGTRGGGDDLRIGSDLASASGRWETGNTGVAGNIYARARATTICGGDTSPTIRVTR
jgi:hypothetical protein